MCSWTQSYVHTLPSARRDDSTDSWGDQFLRGLTSLLHPRSLNDAENPIDPEALAHGWERRKKRGTMENQCIAFADKSGQYLDFPGFSRVFLRWWSLVSSGFFIDISESREIHWIQATFLAVSLPCFDLPFLVKDDPRWSWTSLKPRHGCRASLV